MDFARLVTPPAALLTDLRVGRDILLVLERFFAPRFVPPRLAAERLVPPRFADDFLAVDVRLAEDRFDDARFAERLRAEPDFPALDLRPLLFRPPPLLRAPALLRPPPRADDLRADAFFAPDFPLLFLPRFEPPRDDFLAAAMIRAPI